MADYIRDIERLRDPTNIRGACLASSPYVLRKAFEKDPIVQRLVKGRHQVVPLVAQELERSGKELPEITLACLTYILEKVDPAVTIKVVEPLFRSALEQPGAFFVHFAAHAFRNVLGLPTRPLEITYNRVELAETRDLLR